MYDCYINIYLETANGMKRPLEDKNNNKYILKLTLKSSNQYN